MRIHVTIDAERNEQDVSVSLTPSEGRITFEVPNAGRASACTFSVDAGQLQEALAHLGMTESARHWHDGGPSEADVRKVGEET